jgi:hypothetical protein
MKSVKFLVSAVLALYLLTGCTSLDSISRLMRNDRKIANEVNEDAVDILDKEPGIQQGSSNNDAEQSSSRDSQSAGKQSSNRLTNLLRNNSAKNELENTEADVTVTTYEQYVNAVHKAIREGKTSLVIKATNFDSSRYDDAPAKQGGNLNVLYSGYSYNGRYIDKLAVITFEFSYLTAEDLGGKDMLPDSNPIVINSLDQYHREIQKALNEFKTKITFRINNYNESYSLDLINKYWREEPLRYSNGISVTSNAINNNTSSRILVINITYLDKNSAPLAPSTMLRWRSEAEEKAKIIVRDLIKPGMTDLQKQRVLHDHIVRNASYGDQGTKSHTDYGVLVEGVGVCESYAKAMYRLLNMVGVPCKLIDGEAGGEAHQWNLVQINGIWYHMDATWNDPVGAPPGYISHKYFNLTDEQMRKTHSW